MSFPEGELIMLGYAGRSAYSLEVREIHILRYGGAAQKASLASSLGAQVVQTLPTTVGAVGRMRR